jgi:hypothetical protein
MKEFPTHRSLAPFASSSAWQIMPLQMLISGAVLFVVGILIYMLSGTYDGIISIIGVPIITTIEAGALTIAAILVGLPLRLVPTMRAWWFAHPRLGLIIAGTGTATVIAAFIVGTIHRSASGGAEDATPLQPEPTILVAGLLALAVGLTHLLGTHKLAGTQHEELRRSEVLRAVVLESTARSSISSTPVRRVPRR